MRTTAAPLLGLTVAGSAAAQTVRVTVVDATRRSAVAGSLISISALGSGEPSNSGVARGQRIITGGQDP